MSTPLVHARRLGQRLGVSQLYLKNETVGVSGSFKDRGAVVAVRIAQAHGYRRLVTASSGNAGAAVAAHAAMAGLEAVVLVDPKVPETKLWQIRAFGATVQFHEGLYDKPREQFIAEIRRVAAKLDAYLAFFWEPVNPDILEGLEVIAEEILEQLGRAPDWVVIPTAGGDHLVAHARVYQRFWRQGRIAFVPRLVAVQPEGARPLVEAFREQMEQVPFRPHPVTMASGLRVAFSGDHALCTLKDGTGIRPGQTHRAETVSEAELEQAVSWLLHDEGLWIEPSGAAGMAVIPRGLDEGWMHQDDTVVVPLTGAGWKDPIIGGKGHV